MTIIYHHAQSFRSAYIFSINSLILFGLTLTSFHWADVSHLLFGGFILLRVQLSKIIKKCRLCIIIHIFGTHFGINLFYLHSLKT